MCLHSLRWLALLAAANLFAANPAAGQQSGAAGGRVSDAEIETMAGGAAGFGKKIEEALRREPVAPNGARASHVNARYGPHPRNTFDLWIADAERPSPLAVFIHGGGFRRGDKALLYDSTLLAGLLEHGISVAGIHYRFSSQTEEGTLGSLKDAARFVQFLRLHADSYKIDPRRIACYGGSAGAAASLWLNFRDDMADPGSADPVARQSTRLTCAGAMAAPSTLDYLKWPDIFGISLARLGEMARGSGFEWDEVEVQSERGARLRAETDLLALMSPGDPPFFVHNNEEGGPPRHFGHMAHHPYHARVLKQRAAEVGLEAVIHAPRIGLHDPAGGDLVAFLVRHLKPSKRN